MAINVKDKLITLESLGVAYSAEQDAREEADQALSTRIDNIVAPEGDPSLTEVSDARVSGSTTYNNLKARLDGDKAAIETEISQLSADLNYGHTAEPGYVLRATDSGHGNEWAMVGTPTDEQAETAINKWLDEHQEATTTVQDHSLGYQKLINGTLGFVTPEMFGAIGNGIADDTSAFQSAIDTELPVLANNTYLVSVSSNGDSALEATGKAQIVLNGTIKIKANSFDSYSILKFSNCDNSTITGKGKIVGDRTAHTGTVGEWGHGLSLVNCDSVKVHWITCCDCWGDGIYINDCTNSEVNGVICDNNRRNGLSVISATKLKILNSDFKRSNGVAPMYGVDIEPNTSADVIDVFIDGCRFADNVGGTLSVVNSFNCSTFCVNVGDIELVDGMFTVKSVTENFLFCADSISQIFTKQANLKTLTSISLHSGNSFFVNSFYVNGGSYLTGSMYFLYTDSLQENANFGTLTIKSATFGRLCGNAAIYNLTIGTFINKIITVTDDNINNANLKVDKIISNTVTYGTDTINMYTNDLLIPSNSTETGTIQIPRSACCFDGMEFEALNLSSNQVRLQSYLSTHVLPDGTTGALYLPSGKYCKLKYKKQSNSWYTVALI